MTTVTLNNFNQVGTTKTNNWFYGAGNRLQLLSYSDSFDDLTIDTNRWTNLLGALNQELAGPDRLQQTATASTTDLVYKLPLTHNLDFTVDVDFSSIGVDNLAYLLFNQDSDNWIKVGIQSISGTNYYWFSTMVDGLVTTDTTVLATTTAATIRVIRWLGTLYMWITSTPTPTFIGSLNTTYTYQNLSLALNTESTALVSTVSWSNLVWSSEFGLQAVWSSPLFDSGQTTFWKTITLTTGTLGTDTKLLLRFRTTDDPTPNILDWSPYAIVEFLAGVADLTDLVPAARYYQFDLLLVAEQITTPNTRTVTDRWVADGVTNQFELTYTPIDLQVVVYEQGLAQNKVSQEYVLDNRTLSFLPGAPVNDTNISIEYRVPIVV